MPWYRLAANGKGLFRGSRVRPSEGLPAGLPAGCQFGDGGVDRATCYRVTVPRGVERRSSPKRASKSCGGCVSSW